MLVVAYGNPGQVFKTALTINVGETLALALQFKQKANGMPLDITDYNLKATINFPEPLGPQEFTTQNTAIVITDPTNGKAVWNIPSSLTASFPVGNNYPYDVWLESPNNFEFPTMQGPFVILPTVSPVP